MTTMAEHLKSAERLHSCAAEEARAGDAPILAMAFAKALQDPERVRLAFGIDSGRELVDIVSVMRRYAMVCLGVDLATYATPDDRSVSPQEAARLLGLGAMTT